jgi:trigger factor
MMIGEQSIKEKENSSVELSVTIKQDFLAESYKKILQKYMKSLQLPGFRKGKAPANVLEQKFGTSMKEEAVYSSIDEAVQQALQEVESKYKPLPYSQPSLVDEQDLNLGIDKDLTFAVTYDIMPIFELPEYTTLEIEVPKVEISDADVNEELDRLRDQNALVIDKSEPIAKGDIVTIDIVELDSDANEIEESKRDDFVFTVGSGSSTYKFDDDVVGLKNGESKTVKKVKDEESKEEISFKISVKQVKFRDVPALDDEFAQDVSEEYKTVADLTKGTKEKLTTDAENVLKGVKLEKVIEKILENVKIEVPKSMVDMEVESSWRRFVSQWGMSEEQVLQFLEMQGQTKETFSATWREPAEKELTKQLLIEKIKEKENFEVSQEELESELEKQLGENLNDQNREYYKSLIEDNLKYEKANEFLLAQNTFVEKEKTSFKEFISSQQQF